MALNDAGERLSRFFVSQFAVNLAFGIAVILELLLSDMQALTLPQKFYQRALSGDSLEIITAARTFLKRNSLAEYCDVVLIPALHLARLDADTVPTSEDQQLRIRRVIVEVVATLSGEDLKLPKQRYRGSVLDDSAPGNWLRQQREQVSGPWQGPLGVPAGSVVVSLGLGSSADDLVAELLARVLLCQKVDARHFSTAELDTGLPTGADPAGVSMVYLVSAFPGPERERADAVRRQVRGLFPYAHVVRVFCPGVIALPDLREGAGHADHTATSLVQAMQMHCLAPAVRVDFVPMRSSSLMPSSSSSCCTDLLSGAPVLTQLAALYSRETDISRQHVALPAQWT